MADVLLKLEKKIKILGTIETLSGLHVGGSSQGLEISGIDNPIIRDPLSKEPYIPGSSLKGKLRSLLEKNDGIKSLKNNGLCLDPENVIALVFGLPAEVTSEKNTLTRLIVYDSFLNVESRNKLKNSKSTDAPFTELKTEVVINRVTAEAVPRPLERVPKGAIFNFCFILNIFNGDKQDDFIKLINRGIELLNDDYLGGSGTRGSGKIFMSIKIEDGIIEKTSENYINCDTVKGWNGENF